MSGSIRAPAPASRSFDVVIVGGGAAGTAAACALGSGGVNAAIIDLHEVCPPDFKADKVAGDQIGLMRRLGLFDALVSAGVRSNNVVNMRRGRVLDRHGSCEYNLPYEDLVNAMRRATPSSVARIVGRVANIEATDDRQRVELSVVRLPSHVRGSDLP